MLVLCANFLFPMIVDADYYFSKLCNKITNELVTVIALFIYSSVFLGLIAKNPSPEKKKQKTEGNVFR